MPGVERERREHRVDVVLEVTAQPRGRRRGPLVGIEQRDRLGRERGSQAVFPARGLVVEHRARALEDGSQLLEGVLPVGGNVLDPGPDLLQQRRDPHHEELVEIGADDGEELHPLEQGVVGVVGLREHALVELEPAQFAVQVQRMVPQVVGGDLCPVDLVRRRLGRASGTPDAEAFLRGRVVTVRHGASRGAWGRAWAWGHARVSNRRGMIAEPPRRPRLRGVTIESRPGRRVGGCPVHGGPVGVTCLPGGRPASCARPRQTCGRCSPWPRRGLAPRARRGTGASSAT